METLAEQIGAFVTMALSPPTMGMGGGSVAEMRAQDAWRDHVRAEYAQLRVLVGAGSPEARILDAASPDSPLTRSALAAQLRA